MSSALRPGLAIPNSVLFLMTDRTEQRSRLAISPSVVVPSRARAAGVQSGFRRMRPIVIRRTASAINHSSPGMNHVRPWARRSVRSCYGVLVTMGQPERWGLIISVKARRACLKMTSAAAVASSGLYRRVAI